MWRMVSAMYRQTDRHIRHRTMPGLSFTAWGATCAPLQKYIQCGPRYLGLLNVNATLRCECRDGGAAAMHASLGDTEIARACCTYIGKQPHCICGT